MHEADYEADVSAAEASWSVKATASPPATESQASLVPTLLEVMVLRGLDQLAPDTTQRRLRSWCEVMLERPFAQSRIHAAFDRLEDAGLIAPDLRLEPRGSRLSGLDLADDNSWPRGPGTRAGLLSAAVEPAGQPDLRDQDDTYRPDAAQTASTRTEKSGFFYASFAVQRGYRRVVLEAAAMVSAFAYRNAAPLIRERGVAEFKSGRQTKTPTEAGVLCIPTSRRGCKVSYIDQ